MKAFHVTPGTEYYWTLVPFLLPFPVVVLLGLQWFAITCVSVRPLFLSISTKHLNVVLAAAFICVELSLQDVTGVVLRTPTEPPSTSVLSATQPLTLGSVPAVLEFHGRRKGSSSSPCLLRMFTSHRTW